MAKQIINAVVLSRGDKEDNWLEGDPVLMEDEMVIIRDLGRLKIGDGKRRFSQLPMFPKDGKSIEVTTQGDMIGVRKEGAAEWKWLIAKGPKGDPGETVVPEIGDNGNWYLNGEDTGVPTRGEKGEATAVSLSDDGYWMLDGVKTKIMAKAHPAELLTYIDGTAYLWRPVLLNDELYINFTKKEAANG